MVDIGFAGRFAYLRWLRSRGRLRPVTDPELAEILGVGESWVGKWKKRKDTPEGRSEELAIRAALGDAVTQWLYDGTGVPPEPNSWAGWLKDWQVSLRLGATPEHEVGASTLAKSKKKATPKRGRGNSA